LSTCNKHFLTCQPNSEHWSGKTWLNKNFSNITHKKSRYQLSLHIETYYIKLAEFAIEITEGEVPLSMHFMNSLIRSQDPAHIKLWTYINDVSVQY
jgi:retron-type reverse transcriptase